MSARKDQVIFSMIKRTPLVSLLLAGGAVAVELWPGASTALQLDRAALAGGEWWQVVTCHFAHFGFNHLLWDVLVFLVLGTLCERIDRSLLILAIVLSTIAIPLAVIGFLLSIACYRGLSGIDSALFGLLATILIAENIRKGRRIGTTFTIGLAVAFLLKIAIEMRFSVTVFADSTSGGYVPVPLAHLVGLAAGGGAYAVGRLLLVLKQDHFTMPAPAI